MNDQILYAAYGSNLNIAQMTVRCPNARMYGRTELENYELVFRGPPGNAIATVEPCKGKRVPILLWRISRQDEQAMDLFNGFPVLYRKDTMKFTANSRTVPALVYVMKPEHSPGQPSDYYYKALLEGYRDCGFDLAVLEEALARSQELARQMARSGDLEGRKM